MTQSVFLSASVPHPGSSQYRLDRLAIREAILALVAVTIRKYALVLRGHAAISPLIHHAAHTLNALDNLHIFRSLRFENEIPPDIRGLPIFHWTRDPNKDEREEMLTWRPDQFSGFSAGFFIGGMNDVEQDYDFFRKLHPYAPAFPIASTQGAALILWERGEGPLSPRREELYGNKRYRSLFRMLLQ